MMKKWTSLTGVVLVAGLFWVASCKKEKEPPKPPPPDPLTACRNECKNTSEKMNKECIDELTQQGAFDRLQECTTKADNYSRDCRVECDKKFPKG
jgi:hypothetical protein